MLGGTPEPCMKNDPALKLGIAGLDVEPTTDLPMAPREAEGADVSSEDPMPAPKSNSRDGADQSILVCMDCGAAVVRDKGVGALWPAAVEPRGGIGIRAPFE